jgi:hypothetical protein
MSATLAVPASAVVSVNPSVIAAGGSALDLNGLLLTTSTRVPIGTVTTLASQSNVAGFFGPASQEAALATTYFLGFDNSNIKPGAMLFAQYPTAPVGAWLRGAPLGLSLTQLQAITPGVLTVTIDGTPHTSSTINLSAASSFSAAAEIASLALAVTGPTTASFTGSIAGTVMTVTAVGVGSVLAVGQEVRGGGVQAGTQIVSFGSGTGGTGTYNVSLSQTIASATLTSNLPAISYDSVTNAFLVSSPTTGVSSTISYASGAMAAPLALTAATGATLSQGSAAATPTPFMTNIANIAQNWASFSTTFDPDGGSTSTQKQLFAAWTNGTNDRYVYVAWDTDVSPTTSNNATGSLGNILMASNSSGTFPIYSPTQGPNIAAFVMGVGASIDFSQTDGRKAYKFRRQTGLTADVFNQTVYNNLVANGYNSITAFATANDRFTWLVDGSITGPFDWADSYVDQIWLNNQFQLALMNLLDNVGSIPYNQVGYGLITAALMDPINQGLNFGAFRPGVTLSQAQIAEVNNAAGTKIDNVLSTQGWFLQVRDASPQVRQARGSPPVTFWYMDGQSVQKINLASVEVQ